jgi:hypothetical protein
MSVDATTLPTTSTPQATVQRWLVLVVAGLGVAIAVFALFSVWKDTDLGLKQRLHEGIYLIAEIAMLSIAWLVAWRAASGIANLAIALAITAIYFNGALASLLTVLGHGHDTLGEVINRMTFVLGAGLFVRAAQKFPEAITPERIALSPTIWGRWTATRALFTRLLRPAWLWAIVVILSTVDLIEVLAATADYARLLIIGMGIVYFYINYRRGDAEVRRKVLWFLAWAVAAVVATVIMLAVRAALGSNGSAAVRLVISVTLQVLENLAQLVCVSAAVFYAGAISPSLVIRKTMVFGLTTALLLFVFASIEVFLHHEIVHVLEVTDTFASSLVGGVFGLAFHPVRHYFEHLAGRFLARHGSTPLH